MSDDDYFDDEKALSELLADGVLFCNSGARTTVLYVNCNDVFAWGCADAEDFLTDEIRPLYRMWVANRIWGPVRWVCLKRNQKPQAPVERDMRAAGQWDDAMETLRENVYDRKRRETAPPCQVPRS
jgi:hypothetical protein